MFNILVYQRGHYHNGAIANIQVLKASINEDLTQKAVTNFTCLNIPTNIQQNDLVKLYDTKGKTNYWGVIDSISDNVIKCSQMQSYFNINYLMPKNAGIDTFSSISISEVLATIIFYKASGSLAYGDITYKDRDVSNYYSDVFPQFDDEGQERLPYFTDNKIINLENYLYEIFNTYNRIIIPVADTRIFMICCNPEGIVEWEDHTFDFNYRTLFSTYENITNISIVKQDTETNTVYIYNKEGTTLRGAYTVDVNGDIVAIQNNVSVVGRIGVNKQKYIYDTDNALLDIARKELPTTQYNHKITFDISFNENNKFDDYILAQKIKFFDTENNRMFDTLLTARKFEIEENSDVISKATFTLGKVRLSLTDKLNRGIV